MFNKKLIIASMTMACMFIMTSCFGPKKMTQRIVPTAVNTINSVGLSELNLKHGTDYTIVNTVTADASILYSEQKKGAAFPFPVTVIDDDGNETPSRSLGVVARRRQISRSLSNFGSLLPVSH